MAHTPAAVSAKRALAGNLRAVHARPLQAVQTLLQKNFKRPRPCHNSDTTGWYDGENGTGKETKP